MIDSATSAAGARVIVLTVALDAVDEPLWARLAALLDAGERARAARFHFERHRRQSIAAHALKRLMLTAHAGAAVDAWRFIVADGGKPRVDPAVARAPVPYFNLSHCDGLVACAVSTGIEIGVDVERLTRDAPLELAPTVFADAERGWLGRLPAERRAAGFLALWTAKEAVIKATGLGLRQPLQAFSVGFAPTRIVFDGTDGTEGSEGSDPTGSVPARSSPGEWRLWQQRVGAEHLLALAWRGPAVVPAIGSVRFDVLLDRAAAGTAGFASLVEPAADRFVP